MLHNPSAGLPRHLASLYNEASFNRVFVPRVSGKPSASSSLATIANLYKLGADRDVTFFQNELNATIGITKKTDAQKVCQIHFADICRKGDTYQGGIALALLRLDPTRDTIPQNVVFLARHGKTIIYYDPADHRIWSDATFDVKSNNAWTSNFVSIPGATYGFWNTLAARHPREEEALALKGQAKPARYLDNGARAYYPSP